MKYFATDYHEGCAPEVLEALVWTNMTQTPGYGKDEFCERAKEAIRARLGEFDGEIHFIPGGTQANVTVIAAGLAPYQGVVVADTGHIHGHETGAVEATGHKCIAVGHDAVGRISLEDCRRLVEHHFADGGTEYEAMPGMIYISNTTELGGIYKKADLEALRALCDEYGMLLYLDGARLGYALGTPENDMTLADIARLCDAFTIGGTKQGILFGEAVVLSNPKRFPRFRYMIKRHGGMLAKGRLLGVQFEAIFRDDLYFKLAKAAVAEARRLRDVMVACGVEIDTDSPSNQQFVRFPRAMYDRLAKDYVFEVSRMDDRWVSARVCTSWATSPEDVERLIRDVELARVK